MIREFAGIDKKYTYFKTAKTLLQSIPYDGTSTWGKGADQGFDAFLDAAENMELYDIETDSEVYKSGIHILPPITEDSSPEAMVLAVYNKTKELISSGKFLTFFGGEHSISIGVMRAFREVYPDISILHLDAHADLRDVYMDTPYNHACALHEAGQKTNLIQVGIRSMDVSEKEYLNVDKCFFAQDLRLNKSWINDVLSKLGSEVYITLDLDVFDPSIMPATGTPEPGGLLWHEVLDLMKAVFNNRNVLGFDLVELAPISNQPASDFLVAKLYYKMLSYKFKKGKNDE